MVDGYSFERLKEKILSLSLATDWEVARKEWHLVGVYEAEEPSTCLCGHQPILEICCIHNRTTGNSTEVGNRCVRRFLGLRSDLVFTAIKRVRRDRTKSLNAEAIAFFRERGLLTDWEYRFSQDTRLRRSLTPAQAAQREKINNKILEAISRRGFLGPE